MDDLELKFTQAENFIEQKKYLHAIQIYKSLLDETESKRKALIRLTEIYDLLNQTDAVISIADEYFEGNPDDDNLRTFIAQFLIRKKRYSAAHGVLSGVSIQNRPEKNFLMGLVNFYLNDYEVAVINFKEFIGKNKKSELLPESLIYLAKCHLALHEIESAAKFAESALKLQSQNSEGHRILAEVYYQRGMYFHANESIQRAIKINPIDPNQLNLSAKIFYKLGEFKKARKELEIYLENIEPDSDGYSFMGMILMEMDEVDEALVYFEKSLKLNSENKIAVEHKRKCESKINEGRK